MRTTEGRRVPHEEASLHRYTPASRPRERPGPGAARAVAAALVALALLTIGATRAVAAQSVRGTAVEGPTGEPIAGAFIALVDTTGWTAASTMTAGDGSFRFGQVRPGTYRLRVARTDLGSWTSDPLRLEGTERVTRRLEVAVRPEAVEALRERVRRRCEGRAAGAGEAAPGEAAGRTILFGRVRDGAAGDPVPGAYVYWGAPDGGRASRSETGSDGLFLLCGLPAGAEVELQASAPGRLGQPMRLIVPAGTVLVRDLRVSEESLAAAGGDLGGIAPLPDRQGDSTVSLRGRVRSAESGEPVSGARVTVLETGDQRITGGDGTFLIRGLPRAPLRVVTEHVGTASDTVRVHLGGGSVTVALFTLETAPVRLPALEVSVERTLQNPRLAGYYERLDRKAMGQFITREDLQTRDIIFNFRSLMGVDVRQCVLSGGLREPGCWEMDMVRGPRIGAATCQPVIYLDGRRVLGENPFDVLRSYPPDMLEGIEVYRGLAGAPAQYRTLDSACGVVLAWTRGRG